MKSERVAERMAALRSVVREYADLLEALDRWLDGDNVDQGNKLSAIVEMGDSVAVIGSRASDLARVLNPPPPEMMSQVCGYPPIGGRRY